MSIQNSFDSCHQFFWREWLDHIVINAQFKAKQLVIFFSTGGKHNDRNVFPLLDFLAGGKAVQSWHHNIHNNQVKILFPTEGNGFHAIFCLCHFIFFKLSIFPNDVPDICFIIDYQQTIHLYLASFLFLRKNRPKIGRFLIFCRESLHIYFAAAAKRNCRLCEIIIQLLSSASAAKLLR